MHVAFRWVFAKNPVHDNRLLPCKKGCQNFWEACSVQNTYLSSNQPAFPRNQLAVWHGPAGMRPKASTPTMSVKRPCVMSATQICHIRIAIWPAPFQWLKAYLNQEEPSPSSLAGHTSHMKKSISKQSREDICDAHASPKPAQPNRKLVMFIEIREI